MFTVERQHVLRRTLHYITVSLTYI